VVITEPAPAPQPPPREFVEAAQEREAEKLAAEATAKVAQADTLRSLWTVLRSLSENGVPEPSSEDEIRVIRKYYYATLLPPRLQALMREYDEAVGGLWGALREYLAAAERLGAGERAAAPADAARRSALNQEVEDLAGRFTGLAVEIQGAGDALARAVTAEDSLRILAGFSRILDDLNWQGQLYRQRMAELRDSADVLWEIDPGTALTRCDETIAALLDHVAKASAAAQEVTAFSGRVAASDEALPFVVEFEPVVQRMRGQLDRYAQAVDSFRMDMRFAASPADSNRLLLRIHQQTRTFVDSTLALSAQAEGLEQTLHRRIQTEESERREAQIEESARIFEESAAPLIERALERHDALPRSGARRAQVMDEAMALYKQAETALRQCVQLNPYEVDYRLYLARILEREAYLSAEEGRFEDQARFLEQWLRVDKVDWNRYTSQDLRPPLNEAAAAQFRTCLESWLDVLNHDRGSHDVYRGLAYAYYKLGQPDSAAVCQQRALRLLLAEAFLSHPYPTDAGEQQRIGEALRRLRSNQDREQLEVPFHPLAYATGPVDTCAWIEREYELATYLLEAEGQAQEAVVSLERLARLPRASLESCGQSAEPFDALAERVTDWGYDPRRLAVEQVADELAAAGKYTDAYRLYAELVDSTSSSLGRLRVAYKTSLLDYQYLDRKVEAVERMGWVLAEIDGAASGQDRAGCRQLRQDVCKAYGPMAYNKGLWELDQSKAAAREWFERAARLECWLERGKASAQLCLLHGRGGRDLDAALGWCDQACRHAAQVEQELMLDVFETWERLYRRLGQMDKVREVHAAKSAWERGEDPCPAPEDQTPSEAVDRAAEEPSPQASPSEPPATQEPHE